MFNPENVLQYGAIGLLAFVLFVVFAFIKSFVERMFEQNSEDRRFVQERIEKADVAMAGQLNAWIEAHREQIMTSATIAEALGRLQENMGEMLKILRRLNGVSK